MITTHTYTLFPYQTSFRSDVNARIAAIEADCCAVHMPATDLPVGLLAMLADPQGAVFYVMNPIPPAGMEDRDSDLFSVTEAQHVRWNELMTRDHDAAIAFYRKDRKSVV